MNLKLEELSAEQKIGCLELLRQKRLSTAEMITHEEKAENAVAMYEMLMADRTSALGVNLIWEEAE